MNNTGTIEPGFDSPASKSNLNIISVTRLMWDPGSRTVGGPKPNFLVVATPT